MKLPLCIFILCLILNVKVSAQVFNEIYTTNNGLSNNYINAIHIDKRGILWVGTNNGVSFFNGKKWIFFDIYTGNIGKICNNELICGFTEDENKNIYIGTFENGLFVYNYKSNTMNHLSIIDTKNFLSNKITGIAYHSKKIYILSDKGIQYFNTNNFNQINTLIKNEIATSGYNKICFDHDTIYASNYLTGIHKFIEGKPSSEKQISKESMDCIVENNKLYYASHDGIYTMQNNKNIKNLIFENGVELKDDYYLGIGKIKNGLYLHSYKNGIYISDSVKGYKIYCHKLQLSSKVMMPNSFIITYYDSIKNVFILGMSFGITIAPADTLPFRFVPILNNANPNITNIIETDNQLQVASGAGIFYVNKKNNIVVKNLPIADGTIIYKQLALKNHDCLIGTNKGMLLLRNNKLIQKLPSELCKHKNFQFCQYLIINDSVVLLGSYENDYMIQWNLKSHTTVEFQIPLSKVGDMELWEGNVIISSLSGIFTFNLASKKITVLDSIVQCTGICKANDAIYVATYNKGLLRINRKLQLSNVVLKSKTIPIKIFNIISDTSNNIWFTTNEGIFKLNDYKLEHYYASDGIVNTEFGDNTNNKWNENIYFNKPDGYLKLNKVAYKIVKESIWVIGILIKMNGRFEKYNYHNQPIELSYLQNAVKVIVASNNYLHPDKSNLIYSINNSNNWLPLPESGEILLTELGTGEYELQIKEENFDTIQANSVKVKFTILPPWYNTWWFKLFMFLLIGLILFLAFNYYYKSELKKKQLQIEKLEAVEKERHRMSADLHDDIGSHISTVQLLANKVAQDSNSQFVDDFKNTVKELGQKIREIIWVTKSENDSLKNCILYIRQYIVKQMDIADIVCKIVMPETIPDYTMDAEMRRDVLMCVKECVNNIMKHAQASRVDVQITINDTLVTIVLKDDGKGMQEANVFGNGLKQMDARMKKYSGGYKIINENGVASFIHFELLKK